MRRALSEAAACRRQELVVLARDHAEALRIARMKPTSAPSAVPTPRVVPLRSAGVRQGDSSRTTRPNTLRAKRL
jgi:hypothetical protein